MPKFPENRGIVASRLGDTEIFDGLSKSQKFRIGINASHAMRPLPNASWDRIIASLPSRSPENTVPIVLINTRNQA
jgi:hypothetical protein